MESKTKLHFIETLLELAETTCTRATQINEGTNQYLMMELLNSPQLHATLNALHLSLPYVELGIIKLTFF